MNHKLSKSIDVEMISQNRKKEFRQLNSLAEYEVFGHIVQVPKNVKYNVFRHIVETHEDAKYKVIGLVV